jgi:magnesium transporter
MCIVAASLYRDGKRIGPVSLDQPVRCATDRSEFVWIGLFEPSEVELRQLQENYDLHPLAIEDALLAHQLPKLDIYGD